MNKDLYRQEALDYQKRRLFGSVSLRLASGFSLCVMLLLASVLATLIYIFSLSTTADGETISLFRHLFKRS